MQPTAVEYRLLRRDGSVARWRDESRLVWDEAMFVPVTLKSSCPLVLSPVTVTDTMSPAVVPSPEGSV